MSVNNSGSVESLNRVRAFTDVLVSHVPVKLKINPGAVDLQLQYKSVRPSR